MNLLAMLTVMLVATFAATALWQQWRGVEIEAVHGTLGELGGGERAQAAQCVRDLLGPAQRPLLGQSLQALLDPGELRTVPTAVRG